MHGRGACDMKGGRGGMVFAAEVLAGRRAACRRPRRHHRHRGGVDGRRRPASRRARRGRRGDRPRAERPGGLARVPRVSSCARIDVHGRAGHAGLPPRTPDDGGAVNAIEKTAYLSTSIGRLREDWALRPRHRTSPRPIACRRRDRRRRVDRVLPGACTLDCHIEYLPDRQATPPRPSTRLRDLDRARRDAIPGCAPTRRASSGSSAPCPPAEMPLDGARRQDARRRRPGLGDRADGGLDNWHDGATLMTEAGIPAICLRPRRHPPRAHHRRERPDRRARRVRAGLALAALRYCG